jgi:hypothetical protein
MTACPCLQDVYIFAARFCLRDNCGAELRIYQPIEKQGRPCARCEIPVDMGTLVISRSTHHTANTKHQTPHTTHHTHTHTTHHTPHTTHHSTNKTNADTETIQPRLHTTLNTPHTTRHIPHIAQHKTHPTGMVLWSTPECPWAVLLSGRSGPRLHVASAQCALVCGNVRCWPTHHFSKHIDHPVAKASCGPAKGVQGTRS